MEVPLDQRQDFGRAADPSDTAAGAVALPREQETPRRPAKAKPRKRKASAFWMKQLHSWHWISAAVSLIAILLFAITGVTLNHADTITAEAKVVSREGLLPPALLSALHNPASPTAPLPRPVAAKVAELVGLDPAGRPAEWSDAEVYVAMPGPGSDAWVSIDRASGAVTSEHTDRGWIAYFNDLHKGRNAGTAWFWFIDLFAGACILFTLTGLLLLQLHAKNRPSTWPLVALGTAIPAVIALFFLH